MSRKKKKGYMGNPANPWIVINKDGVPEKKGNKIRMFLTRRRCLDYINSRSAFKENYTPIRFKDLFIAKMLIE